MSTNKTPNYQLHSWTGTDYVKRTEFNDNFTAIDTTMKALDTAVQGKASTSHSHSNATSAAPGFMSKEDKAKIDTVEQGANNYTHPSNHPASIITQDANNRFVTDKEKSDWNGKASTDVATSTKNGLMSKDDKVKLDTLADMPPPSQDTFANILVNGVTVKAKGATDTFEIAAGTNVLVTGDATNKKATISLSTNVETTAGAQAKANAAETNAKNASAPSSHVGSTGTAHGVATTSVNGFMSSADKNKLDGIATGATNYTHPATHPPSIIVQDANNRFVTDTEKSTWNAKASTAVATTSADGLMAKTDKSKLDGIASGAQVNTVTSVAGKTGAVTLTATDVGLGNVTNESKATMFTGAALTGVPTAPTASNATANTQIATTAFVKNQGYLTSVPSASTTVAGIVKLNNGLSSTSTVEAATANTVRMLAELIGDTGSINTPDVSTAIEDLQRETDSYKTVKSNKDSNGIYTTIEHRRKSNNALLRKSVLSGGTSPKYTTRTVTSYAANGTTVIKTDVFTLNYDSDDELLSEV